MEKISKDSHYTSSSKNSIRTESESNLDNLYQSNLSDAKSPDNLKHQKQLNRLIKRMMHTQTVAKPAQAKNFFDVYHNKVSIEEIIGEKIEECLKNKFYLFALWLREVAFVFTNRMSTMRTFFYDSVIYKDLRSKIDKLFYKHHFDVDFLYKEIKLNIEEHKIDFCRSYVGLYKYMAKLEYEKVPRDMNDVEISKESNSDVMFPGVKKSREKKLRDISEH